MSRYVVLYILTLLLALAVALAVQSFALRPVTAQGRDTYGAADATLYIHGAVQPPTAGVTVHVKQPGGSIRDAVTRDTGEWGVGVTWRSGTYVLSCDGSPDGYAFAVPAGTEISGPWVFVLSVQNITETATIYTQDKTTTPTRIETPTVAPQVTATLSAIPTLYPTITPKASATPSPLPEQVVLVWQFSGELVAYPTAGVWTVSLTVQDSPQNYTTWLRYLLEEAEAAP